MRLSHALCLLSSLAGACSSCAGQTPLRGGDANVAADAPLPADGRGPADAAGGGPDGQLPGNTADCPAGFRTALAAGQHAGFSSGGQQRSFHLLLPPASFAGPRPLVVAFHGTGMTGEGAISSYQLDDWVSAGFIVLAPDANGNGTVWPVWDALELPGTPERPNADLTLFDDLVACVAAHHPVDARRVYVLGQSAGGAMTNFVLGRRSSLLAGGVPASGAFDLTQVHAGTISPVTVIVTWGGDNDMYSGSAGESEIASIGYVEQSALASQYWESRPGSHQIACRGHDLGHVWLNPINGWIRDVLLAHPKGSAVIPGWTLPPLPGGAPVTCSEAAATYVSPITVSCPASSRAGCQAYCQLIGDCIVENGTLGPVMVTQLSDLGYAATANVCSGCVTRCEQDAEGSAADGTVLGCIASAAPGATCGPGFAGAAIFGVVGGCCAATPGSDVCARFCQTFQKSALFSMVLSGCP